MKSWDTSQASRGVATKCSVFTFVPVVQKLPIKSVITEEGTSLRGKANQNFAASHEETAGDSMSDGQRFQAEFIYIKESMEGGAGNMIQPETKCEPEPRLDHVTVSQTSISDRAQSENTPKQEAAGTVSMEMAVNKHRAISQQQCHDTGGRAKVSSGFFASTASDSEDSPTNLAHAFPTPASSRESILSEGSDRERSLSMQLPPVTSPVSISRTISPCSSVLSGIFSPAVIQIKRHFLAPGSSLVNSPPTSFSSSESLSSAVRLQSPPPRHRPPLTRLSLLTAILRKGRLPVLSPALQRPYTPCWPVNPVTLSFCNACSAASSVASIPLEFSSRFPSSVSVDHQLLAHSEPHRHVTSPPVMPPNEHSDTSPPVNRHAAQFRPRSAARWERVVSPPLVTSSSRLTPASLSCQDSDLQTAPKHQEMSDYASSKKFHSLSKPQMSEPSSSHVFLRDHEDINLKTLTEPKLVKRPETSELQKLSRQPNSSLSKLHWLSDQLRSPPSCSPQHQPSAARSPSATASPFPHLGNPTGSHEAQRSVSQQDFPKAHNLSPSCYTPITFLGWPSPICSPTPTPSPAPLFRDLTPSPCLSLRSTPSPRPGSGISDCSSEREGKKRTPHKIKSSYKSLAAIPTNTLLLDQQAIDDQVERVDTPLSVGDTLDTHAEMCSPAQLRQQSQELYATIDEILAASLPPSRTSSRASTPSNISFPKSLGRETKYASLCSLTPSAGLLDSKKTKPGVIRPMTAVPRLTVEEEEYHHNPFRQFVIKQTLSGDRKVGNMGLPEMGRNGYTGTKSQTFREKENPVRGREFSERDLPITEDLINHPERDAPTALSSTASRMEAF